jgi:acyl-CoA synthetase (AMP-forming)/AMP-acid ligase II
MMIVTGGENVYSGEVEAVIYEHPTVREAGAETGDVFERGRTDRSLSPISRQL